MKILFIGDIVGKPGRQVVSKVLPILKKEYGPFFTIANGENITHGKGINQNHYTFLTDLGVDCITLGNHYDDRFELKHFIDQAPKLVRPLNLTNNYPGFGSRVFRYLDKTIRVSNLLGKVFMHDEVANPFDTLQALITKEDQPDIHIVDFHAEATSEKYAFGLAFDGVITAMVGTHTHIQTNDARLLPKGTGFICDVGMCGAYDSILGVKSEVVIDRLWHGGKNRFELEERSKLIFSGVLLEIDPVTFHTVSVTPIKRIIENL